MKFLLVYIGGETTSPAEVGAVTAMWNTWFNSLGDVLADRGFPFKPSTKMISSSSAVTDFTSNISGYSVVNAANIQEAVEIAKSCPHLLRGGDVEVVEEWGQG